MHVDVKNDERYKPYAAANPTIFRKFGGRFLVRAGKTGKYECVEGTTRSRQVVIEFPDYALALACYHSPEYQANIKVRQPHSTLDFIIVEGYDGPQPYCSSLSPRGEERKKPAALPPSPHPGISPQPEASPREKQWLRQIPICGW